jgi:acyl dehydratase
MTASRTTELRTLQGRELGPTTWQRISQQDVDQFGRLAGDSQWIHTDPDMATLHGPFGGTIVHGALLISVATTIAGTLLPAIGATMIVNAGLASARLRTPVRTGARVRGTAAISDVEDLGAASLASVRVTLVEETEESVVATVLVKLVIHG